MNKGWYIRPFERKDLPDVVKVNKSCLPENYPNQFFLGLYHHAPKAFLVGIDNDKLAGYIMCRIERGVSSFGIMPVKKGHIVSVAVMDIHRRKGIGYALIRKGMAAMSEYGVSEYFLEVRKSNNAAIGVYEKLGFSIKRVLKGYYRDGEDAYLMARKSIKDEPIESE
ncbi:MAG: GNAT family N-acetyltransferase [Candidatus Lokiarchaeota archaeon]|nr:GNAT family N-acetyltransferase [Candidatus Lokiarchaeota archaeon]